MLAGVNGKTNNFLLPALHRESVIINNGVDYVLHGNIQTFASDRPRIMIWHNMYKTQMQEKRMWHTVSLTNEIRSTKRHREETTLFLAKPSTQQ